MPDYRALARQAAGEVGVPEKLFLSLVRHESGFNPRARSPVGAEGLTQLMPGTAHGLATKYGIDTSTPYGNLLGGAYYLKQQIDHFSGDLRMAVAAYNAGPGAVEKYGGVPPYAETQRYVKNVLGSSGMSKFTSRFPATQTTEPPQQASSAGLQNALIQNLANIGATGHADPSAMLAGISQGIALDRQAPAIGGSSSPGPPGFESGTLGKVTVAPNANRAGVGINPKVISFAEQVAGLDGRPLTIGTGTNHNRFVVGTDRQSAHWTGRAADIPATGADLTRLGRAALVAAGMPPAQAAKQRGGLFNIGGYQIIFNSSIGGNHYNHLHVVRLNVIV